MTVGLAISGAVSFAAGQLFLSIGKPTIQIGDGELEGAAGALKRTNNAPSEASAGILAGIGVFFGAVGAITKVAGVALLLVGVLFSGLGAGLLASSVTTLLNLDHAATLTGVVVGSLAAIWSIYSINR
jgi:phage shock protein PspC (stress-responsive transcriptional regulator)